jgi:hypothetical protein
MEIPSLPTDSLYKFLAISGAVLIVYGIYIRHSNILATADNIHLASKIVDLNHRNDSLNYNEYKKLGKLMDAEVRTMEELAK